MAAVLLERRGCATRGAEIQRRGGQDALEGLDRRIVGLDLLHP
jgi:hypothetical protein